VLDDVPGFAELLWLLAVVEGELELDEPVLDEPEPDAPEFAPEVPVSGVVLLPDAPAEPGMVPHGELLEEDPGVVFGFIVEG
jgi:hypothetical protein